MDSSQGTVFREVTVSDLEKIRRYVRESATAQGCDPVAVEELIVAVNEALVNIVRYGYQNQPGQIKVMVGCSSEAVAVILRDYGPRFDPTAVPDPDTALPLEERPFGGMGVHMMRAFSDELRYRRDPGGANELTIIKNSKQ